MEGEADQKQFHSLSMDSNATLSCSLDSSVNTLNGGRAANKKSMNNIDSGKNWFFERHRLIPVYLPNLVGYLRVICTTVAIGLAFTRPKAMLICYFASFVCDELDGRLARLFGQQSTYGAVLDMVTDRLSTAALLGILGVLYPSIAQVCVFLTALDIGSHWCHMYASLVSGGTSHKDLEKHHNWLIRLYYGKRLFMGYCCVSCEVLFLIVYALHFFPEMLQMRHSWLMFAVLLPGFFMKQTINVIQLIHGFHNLALHDLKTL